MAHRLRTELAVVVLRSAMRQVPLCSQRFTRLRHFCARHIHEHARARCEVEPAPVCAENNALGGVRIEPR